jgi:hypothetical protein
MEMAGKHSDHYFRRWQANIAALFHGLLIKVIFNGSRELLDKPSTHRQWLVVPAA